MNLKEISQGYFNQFIKNPKQLDLFLMYKYTQKLNNNVIKLEELETQQDNELSI